MSNRKIIPFPVSSNGLEGGQGSPSGKRKDEFKLLKFPGRVRGRVKQPLQSGLSRLGVKGSLDLGDVKALARQFGPGDWRDPNDGKILEDINNDKDLREFH